MEGKKEISEKYLKYLALKKQIEKKEKKLQKFNRVLEAKDHVKKKLKECNQPEENGRLIQSENTSHDTGRQDTITTTVLSKISSPKKHSLPKQNQVSETNSPIVTSETATSKLLDNSVTPNIKKTSLESLIKKDKIQPSIPDNKIGSDCSSFESSVLKIRKDSRNNHGNDIDITTCYEQKNKGRGQDGVYDTDNIGQSEESPILIGDSQPSSTPLSTDTSQNSALGSKRRLSLKRKKNLNSKSELNLSKKSKPDEGSLNLGQGEEKQMSVDSISKIRNKNKNQEKENVVNHIETADSLENSENVSQSLLGTQVKSSSEVKLKDGYNLSSQELFECSQTQGSMKQKRRRSSKLNKDPVNSFSESRVIQTKEDMNPSDNVGVMSQETVIECTPDVRLPVDLDKAFVLDTADTAVNDKLLYSTKAAILIDNEESSVKTVSLSSCSNTQSSSQDSLIGRSQENSQPRRRGRPSKTKRSKQKKTAFSTRFNFPEKNKNSEEKLQTVDDQKGLKENIGNYKELNLQSSQDTVIECTPDIPFKELHHGITMNSHQVIDYNKQNLIDLNPNSETSYEDLEMKEITFNKLELMNSQLKTDKRLLVLSQESTSSTLSNNSTDTCNRRKKRGRPIKKKSIRKTAERENSNAFLPSKEVDPTLNLMKNKSSQVIVDISGSQELFDHDAHSEDHCLSENKSSRGDKCDKNFDSQITDQDTICTETFKSNALVYESQELSTLKLLQESFVEKKEYSTRRRSSMGSPFMISSLFQYIIDESKRNIKEFKEFDLPVSKFGKLLKRNQENIDHHDSEAAKALSIICDETVNKGEVEDVNKLMDRKQKDANNIKDMNNDISMSKEASELIKKATNKDKHSDSSEIVDKKIIPQKKELNLNQFSCESQEFESQTPLKHFELPKICQGTNDDSQDELFIPKFTSSQSLFTPNPKEVDRMNSLECNQEVIYENSQTDSMDSQLDITCMTETDQQNSLQLPEDESLISLCTCSMKFRKKEVPVIGCLTRKSLSLWRYKKGFSPLHTWEFTKNQTAEKVCSFSMEGRALFIITARRGSNYVDVYLAHYSSKRDNCLFTVTNVEADIVEACHVSNRVIMVGYSKDKIIHVTKYVLHNNLKSLANSENLESTEGCLQSLYSVDNLPAAVSVWSSNGEFCLWNHENKGLLIKMKLECLNNVPKLVGVAWEEGFFFLQFFNVNDQSGKQVIVNPLTMTSCVGSHFECGIWSGYRSHLTSTDVIITLDRNQNLNVWDRYSTDLLHESKQSHATCVAHLDGHVATGSEHCVHIH
ncbi:uro-adherence factor A-like [Mytilus edulis]|uniref:uro-adherence factor A-like n=1 Tax=Mytilus edulis TaxID=6550 RepID=UPI0039EE55F6